jgi:uncharacterized membrane protein YfcA
VTIELGLAALAVVALACALSGFAHGALGFGFPMVATPLVALVVDIKAAIALTAPLTLVLVVISVLRGGQLGRLLREWWFMPAVMALGAWLGTLLLLAAPPEPFLLVLAAVIVVYLRLDRLGISGSPRAQRLRVPLGLAFGLGAGFTEAVANVAGPLLLVYFMLLGISPMPMVQALNLCFMFGKGAQVITWSASGAMSASTWLAVGGLAIPSVAALYAGIRVRERIDAATYRGWLRKALWVMAAVLVAQFAIATARAQTPGTPESRLFEAIEERKELAAEGLVLRGANVNARNAERETPLHLAVEKGMKSLAAALLRAGAAVSARSAHGETALHLAALHSEPHFVELLLSAGADPRARNDAGESALFWAALAGNGLVAQRLLEGGADANAKDLKGNLPLHAAADAGHADIVAMLIAASAEPGARNREGASARSLARSRGYDDIVQLLERFGE